MPTPLYSTNEGSPLTVDREFYKSRAICVRGGKPDRVFTVPKRSGQAWKMQAGEVCRIVAIEGPQVVDFNAWNQHDTQERFWASRTRQLVGSHVNRYDQLWSCLPYLRPVMTVIDETIHYGIDSDGAGCHDLLGTRCDPYIHKILTGEDLDTCCHSNLLRAAQEFGLLEADIHDVINIFQVTGLTPQSEQYFVKPCPAKQGDYFEFYAEIDLICALSTCPHGDMSKPIWGEDAVDSEEICRPIGVEIYAS
jgi:uncharacterized protein YcgI (DUF1989 family)